jgi:hypothetical protein
MTILRLALLTTTHSIFLVVLTEVELAAAIEAEAPAKEAQPRQPTRRRTSGGSPCGGGCRGGGRRRCQARGGQYFQRLEDEVAVVVPPGEEDRDPQLCKPYASDIYSTLAEQSSCCLRCG